VGDRVHALVNTLIATIGFIRPCVSEYILVDDIDIIFALFWKPGAARADGFLQVTLGITLALFGFPSKKFITLTFLRRHSVQPSRLLWGMELCLLARWLIANRIYGGNMKKRSRREEVEESSSHNFPS
jgi:hypothetical protein